MAAAVVVVEGWRVSKPGETKWMGEGEEWRGGGGRKKGAAGSLAED